MRQRRHRPLFAADLLRSTTSMMAVSQRLVGASAFGDTASAAAWRTVPSWALTG
ncbi:hypothetical protein [Streptomyces sp. R35]|uniref:Uncharacterized protein n=1 Tax=Streptomyces sp. R35 TaxID=3238630 RepID=A0AB39RY98_9ACTN